MEILGARDRLVMGGLVLLGLLTVVAGVLTGRTTLQYVLQRDAMEAIRSWTQTLEAAVATKGTIPDKLSGQTVSVYHPEELVQRTKANAKPSDSTELNVDGEETLSGLESFFLGLMQNSKSEKESDYVSRLGGFAVLTPDRRELASSGSLQPQGLEKALRDSQTRAALNSALINGKIEIANPEFGKPLAFVPIKVDGHIQRVYAFEVDEKAAASMTYLALTVVSLATSLLIVMGFSIPALVASRRIRERWKAEDRIRFLALHDPLTSLPNRAQLRQTLDQAVLRSKRHNKPLAVLCLDLDRFKDINDTLGHPAGDALLQEVSDRLRANVREVDLIGRLGGDEFAIVAEDLDTPEDALPLARRVCQSLGETYRITGHDVISSCSIGIAIGPYDGENGDELLKNADLALYRAKQDGRNTYRFFEPEMDAALQNRRRIENELRLAIRNEQIRVEYQPQFDLQTGELTGYEALARWHHPTDGDIPPSVFLPLAEETGLIAPLGEFILSTACAYARTWSSGTKLAVNLSPAQFKVQDVVAMVRRVLAETGLEPHRLELEITEKLLLEKIDSLSATLQALDRLGVSIAMDDFGTGYSSLTTLTKFPIRKIKIDRSFVGALDDNPQASAIVSSIVGLGRSLHVVITAEGVETAHQADILRTWGCNEVQGFYYGMAEASVPAERALERPPKPSLVA